MENASKALTIAGSILMALMIIGIVTLTYSQISSVQQTKTDVEDSSKMKDYNQKFAQYDKIIYGSELMSLSNLKLDYNYTQSEMKGYTPISIRVKKNKVIEEDGKVYISSGEQMIEDIRRGISKLEEDIAFYEKDSNGYENRKEKVKRSVKYYAQLSNRQIATLFEIGYSSNELDYEIGERLANPLENSKTSKLLKDIEKYKNLKTAYTEFKNTSFTCDEMVYGDNGRVNFMSYSERS